MMERLRNALRDEREMVRNDPRRSEAYLLLFAAFILIILTGPEGFHGMDTLIPFCIGISFGYAVFYKRQLDHEEDTAQSDHTVIDDNDIDD